MTNLIDITTLDSLFATSFTSCLVDYSFCQYTAEYVISAVEETTGKTVFASCGYDAGKTFESVQLFCIEHGYDLN